MNLTAYESNAEVIDVDELLARCLGNTAIAERVLTKFQDRFDTDLDALSKGIDEQDADTIASVAHRIKGASANVSAPMLYEIASEIEALGRAQRISEIARGVEQLRNEWARFVHGVSSLNFSRNTPQ